MKAIAITTLLALPAALAGCGDMSDVPASNMPTIEQMGVDPGTANLEMCSDGAMRENCADAPMEF